MAAATKLHRADVPAVLARHGLVAGVGGYDPIALAEAAAVHGWAASVEERPRTGRYRCRALLHAVDPARVGTGHSGLQALRGSGATPGEALAQAVARLLGKIERA